MFKKVAYSLAFALLFTSISAEAKFGGGGGRRMGGGSAMSRPMPAPSQARPGGFSQGGNAGMQRGTVMNDVRTGKTNVPPSNSAAAAGNNGATAGTAPAPMQAPPRAQAGFGTGTLLGTAAVAGLIGYMMHRDSNGNTYYTNPQNPGVAYGSDGKPLSAVPQGDFQEAGIYNGQAAAAPAQNKSSGGFGWFTWLLLLGGAYFLFKRFTKPKALAGNNRNYAGGAAGGATVLMPNTGNSGASITPTSYGSSNTGFFRSNPQEEINNAKEQFFIDFQKNNRPSQINFIRSKTDPAFFDEIQSDVMAQPENKVVNVSQLQSQLVDYTPSNVADLASVRYVGNVVENGTSTPIDEVWHFVYVNKEWLLAGIEQV